MYGFVCSASAFLGVCILLYVENYVHRVPQSIEKEVEKAKKKEL